MTSSFAVFACLPEATAAVPAGLLDMVERGSVLLQSSFR